jgi:tetratricopeptide (TPR) repeat protein
MAPLPSLSVKMFRGGRMSFARFRWIVLLCASLALGSPIVAQHEHGGAPEKLGKVSFPVSCSPAVQPQFNLAVAMLHSFWYAKSAEAFSVVAKADPACGMAFWGVAMAHYHPLWEIPNPEDLKQGAAAAQEAKAVGSKSERERQFIEAIGVYYKDYTTVGEIPRNTAYAQAMEQIHNRFPDDRETSIFYALALRAAAPAGDKTYANQKKAGAILEKIFAVQPDHPGVVHYIIHCYDYPALAAGALEAARHYAKIAPDSPHALHMPSHIFTRLGLWQESIESNLASAAAARKNNGTGDELHAVDYLVYAYLQGAQDREAKDLFKSLRVPAQSDPASFAGYYSIGTVPARFALERHRWDEAAALIAPPDTFPGGRYAPTEANFRFARALGAARIGKLDAAREDLQRLIAMRDALAGRNEKYWAEQVEIQRETVVAWISFAEGKKEDALRQMRAATIHEEATDKSAVTPGAVLPARELLGDMLMELNHPGEALHEYEAALRSAPNRFNSLSGAARAAQLSGDQNTARKYYQQLLILCKNADGDRPELRDAKIYTAQK